MRIELSPEQNIAVAAEYILTLLIFSCLVHCFLKGHSLVSLTSFFKNPDFYVTVFDENHFSRNYLMHKCSLIILSCS